jgi:NAD(P)-dependent dehydrogenase (short-subunit alcohol dehydrogenase family)
MAKRKSDLPSISDLVSLSGRRALITGAASGIGKAIAHRFAEAGACLELVDVDSKGLKAARDELKKTGSEVNIHIVDLSKKKEIDELWESLKPEAPDILVNNAGFYPFKDFVDVEEIYYRKVMDTNLDSVYWMCQHLVRQRLKKKQGGVIINMGSIEAILPFKEDLGHYSVSKAGVIALTRALAKEHARHGFRVNAILPGGIITSGTKDAAKQILRFKFGLVKTGIEFAQRLPIQRAGLPDEVARIALVLASDLATYVHGALIPVDGGFLAA